MHNTDILKLNQQFYEHNAISFSLSRKSAWPGWIRAVKQIEKIKMPAILDVGCGNGRFYGFLRKTMPTGFSYLGIDFSRKLIDEAVKTYGEDLFYVQNFLNSSTDFVRKFNVISGFGIMHHIPNNRGKFVKTLVEYLKPSGLLILSFWVEPPLPKKIVKDFGGNDFLLSWDTDSTHPRFGHIFTQKEVDGLAAESRLKTVETYFSDGKNNKSNLYTILQK